MTRLEGRAGLLDVTLNPGVPRTFTFTLTDADGVPVEAESLVLVLGGDTVDVSSDTTGAGTFPGTETTAGVWTVPDVVAPDTIDDLHRLRVLVDDTPWMLGHAYLSPLGTESPNTNVTVTVGAAQIAVTVLGGTGTGADEQARQAAEAAQETADAAVSGLAGKADLDDTGKVPLDQLPPLGDTVTAGDGIDIDGTEVGVDATVVRTDDPRLFDARTPLAHTQAIATITGLEDALNDKANAEDLADVATTGAYDDLTGRPSLGSAATADVEDFATATQGSAADSAVQPGDLATVATTGDYDDLTGKPSIPATAADVDAVPTTRTVAGKALSADVTLDADDVGADPEGAAADAVAALREVAAGIGTQPNTGVTGFLGVDATTRRRAGVEVGNTSTETTMLPSAISYAANHFNLSRVLQLDFGGLYTNNSAANRDVTVRVKLQGKTVFAFAATAIPASATTRSWRASCRIQFGDFVGIRAFGFGAMSMSAAGAGFDLGGVTVAADLAQTFDLAATAALDVTVQHSTNNSNLKMSVANFYATELLAVT